MLIHRKSILISVLVSIAANIFLRRKYESENNKMTKCACKKPYPSLVFPVNLVFQQEPYDNNQITTSQEVHKRLWLKINRVIGYDLLSNMYFQILKSKKGKFIWFVISPFTSIWSATLWCCKKWYYVYTF